MVNTSQQTIIDSRRYYVAWSSHENIRKLKYLYFHIRQHQTRQAPWIRTYCLVINSFNAVKVWAVDLESVRFEDFFLSFCSSIMKWKLSSILIVLAWNTAPSNRSNHLLDMGIYDRVKTDITWIKWTTLNNSTIGIQSMECMKTTQCDITRTCMRIPFSFNLLFSTRKFRLYHIHHF